MVGGTPPPTCQPTDLHMWAVGTGGVVGTPHFLPRCETSVKRPGVKGKAKRCVCVAFDPHSPLRGIRKVFFCLADGRGSPGARLVPAFAAALTPCGSTRLGSLLTGTETAGGGARIPKAILQPQRRPCSPEGASRPALCAGCQGRNCATFQDSSVITGTENTNTTSLEPARLLLAIFSQGITRQAEM